MKSNSPTWVEILRMQGEGQGDQTAFRFLPHGNPYGAQQTLSYAGLFSSAKAIAAHLAARCIVGERVVLVYPAGLEFIKAFCGALLAGVVPVPIKAPGAARRDDFDQRFQKVVNDCGASFVLSDEEITRAVASSGQAHTIRWIDTTTIPAELASE